MDAELKGDEFTSIRETISGTDMEKTPALSWLSDTEFTVGDDLRFKCLLGDYHADKTDADHLVILKDRALITLQMEIYRDVGVKRAFEFGIFQGGSVMLLTEALGLERMAALDFSEPVQALDAMIEARGLSERIRLSYGVSQRDHARMEDVIRSSFALGEIDLIVDDCSHLYDLTKNSFDVAFPYLKPGGLYVIEDWGWAHWSGYWQTEDARWRDRPAMSNLIFELVMATATSPKVIEQVTIYPSVVILRKAKAASVGEPVALDRLYALRGKTLGQI